MIPVFVAVVFAALTAGALLPRLAHRVQAALRAAREREASGTEECSWFRVDEHGAHVCGVVMRRADAHVVAERWDDPESPGAGTAVAQAFCLDHCPGGCNRLHVYTHHLHVL